MNACGWIGLAAVAGGMALGGCASTSTAPAHEQQGMGMQGMEIHGGMCPTQVPGATVSSTDVEGGVALDFKTGTGDVAELRQRVRRMADMYNQHGGGMMLAHPDAGPAVEGGGGMMTGGGMTDGGMMTGGGMTGGGMTGGGMTGGMMTDGGMMTGGGMTHGGMMTGGGMTHGGMMTGGGMMMLPATASVADVEGGARLVLRPNDATQLGALRENARMMAQRMNHGDCPMMSRAPAP